MVMLLGMGRCGVQIVCLDRLERFPVSALIDNISKETEPIP